MKLFVCSHGISLSSDLIEALCERGIRLNFLTNSGKPYAMLSSPMLSATVLSRREQIMAFNDERGLEFSKAIVEGKIRDKIQDISGKNIEAARNNLMGAEGVSGRLYWDAVKESNSYRKKRMVQLRVSDLKQFVYCPRVVFFNYVMPVEKVSTFKMEYGKVAEDRIDRLESRRKLLKYGLSHGEREFHKRLYSENYGISGKVDLLIKAADSYYPVDFKFTESQPHKNHLYQLLGYALILQDLYACCVDKGFVYLIPKEDAVVFNLTDEMKNEAMKMLNEIRSMILSQHIPPPVQSRNKCQDCEYRNYCGDVF